MNNFEVRLLRLKQALGIREDQEVAQLLGLSKAAFSDRKRRDAFPEDRLRALALKHPEWWLDVEHILTGESQRLTRRDTLLACSKRASQIARKYGTSEKKRSELQAEVFDAMQFAVALMGADLPDQSAPNMQQNFHGNVGQAAGRDIVNNQRGKKR